MSSTPKRTESSFRRIAVIGLGAMGGSFARAATATTSAEVVGWSPDPAERLSAVDAEAVAAAPERWSEAVAGADLVMLAIPLGPTCKMMAELASTLEPAAVVADVASLKGPVAEAAAEAGLTR
ncbi:MAG: prephenate dehydrogenase/arogenate dehydrogenase family protein, partial [Gemmatimonadales bacterium]|nr:prephenate dehydrogenase/arogenate dehydrogenase family protein [Gemmatimonadales bacterium]